MHTLKNSDIAKKYNVSNSTVTRWIALAERGKNNLQLYKVKGKFRILDNPYNHAEIVRLTQEGKRYRSNIVCKRVSVQPNLYQLLEEEDIIDIIRDIEQNKTINSKYAFIGEGVKLWEQTVNIDLFQSDTEITRLIQELLDFILYIMGIQPNQACNIIDLGSGNGLTIKPIINKILSLGRRINKYIVLDISKEIARLTQQNINKHFPDLEILTYQRDFEKSTCSKIILENKAIDETPNLLFHIGNVLSQYRDRVRVLKNIQSGMSAEDLLVIDFLLDQEDNYFNLAYSKSDLINKVHLWIPKLLGIDVNKCKQEIEPSPKFQANTKYLVLDKDYEITFELFGKKKILELYSGEKLILWKQHLLTLPLFLDEIDKADLRVVNLSLDKQARHAVAICRIKN